MLAQRLRQLRKDKSLTLQQVAQELGVTRACVSKWETGVSRPDLSRLEELAAVLGVTTSDLVRSPKDSATPQGAACLPVVSLVNGVPISALREASQWRHPSLRSLSSEAFFVALGGYMTAHFGLSGVPRESLLLIEPGTQAQSGDLVLVDSKAHGYQILGTRDNGGLLEYVSLGIKLSQHGPISDALLVGVVLESISTLNLKGFARSKTAQKLYA